MEPMICETFLQFRYLSDLGLSPDGRYTAYIRQQANLASNGYDARLWVYDQGVFGGRGGGLGFWGGGGGGGPVHRPPWGGGGGLGGGCFPYRPNPGQSESPEEASGPGGIQNRTCDVLEDIPFWANGLGLTSGQRSQLYIHDPASGVTTPSPRRPSRLQALPWKMAGSSIPVIASRMSRLCATVFLSGTRPVERPGASWNRTGIW